jgi:hypothetical protein
MGLGKAVQSFRDKALFALLSYDVVDHLFCGNIKAFEGVSLIGRNLFWKGSLAVYFC